MPNRKPEKQTVKPSEVGSFAEVFGKSDPRRASKPTEPAAVEPPTVAQDAEDEEEASIRTKEAGDLLAWLHAQGHLKFSSLSVQVLLDIQAGKHRR